VSKQLLKKELILIDFKQNEFLFYHVEVLSVGYKELQVITTSGKLGNKGREHIIRVNEYKEAMKIAYSRIYDKKSAGYLSKQKMKDAITAAAQFYYYEQKTKAPKKTYTCSLCHQQMEPKLHKKINEWARGEGNWDYSPRFIGYKKVICVTCQIEHDIFKKRAGEKKDA